MLLASSLPQIFPAPNRVTHLVLVFRVPFPSPSPPPAIVVDSFTKAKETAISTIAVPQEIYSLGLQWKMEKVFDGSLARSFKQASSKLWDRAVETADDHHETERRAHMAIRRLRVADQNLRPAPERVFSWLPAPLAFTLRYAVRFLGLINGNGYLDLAPRIPEDDTAGLGRLHQPPPEEKLVLPVAVGADGVPAEVDAEELALILADELPKLPPKKGNGKAGEDKGAKQDGGVPRAASSNGEKQKLGNGNGKEGLYLEAENGEEEGGSAAAGGDGGGGENGDAGSGNHAASAVEAMESGEVLSAAEREAAAGVLATRLLRACGEASFQAALAAEAAALGPESSLPGGGGDGSSRGARGRGGLFMHAGGGAMQSVRSGRFGGGASSRLGYLGRGGGGVSAAAVSQVLAALARLERKTDASNRRIGEARALHPCVSSLDHN